MKDFLKKIVIVYKRVDKWIISNEKLEIIIPIIMTIGGVGQLVSIYLFSSFLVFFAFVLVIAMFLLLWHDRKSTPLVWVIGLSYVVILNVVLTMFISRLS